MAREEILNLAQLHGIEAGYHDIWGTYHATSAETAKALLNAMHVPVTDDATVHAQVARFWQRFWSQPLAPVHVVTVHEGQSEFWVEINLIGRRAGDQLAFRLYAEPLPEAERGGSTAREIPNGGPRRDETDDFSPEPVALTGVATIGDAVDGDEIGGVGYARHGLCIPVVPHLGYYRIELEVDRGVWVSMPLIVAPPRCYQPANPQARFWGPAIQLYAIRSARNWGCGDFTDLQAVIEWVAASGGSVIGLNPLHALFPTSPEKASPYSPSSRMMLNPLYLDIEAMPEFARCTAAQERVRGADFQAEIKRLRALELVDYGAVKTLKWSLFETLYQHFRQHELSADTASARGFRTFQRRGGTRLYRFSLLEAIQVYHAERDANVWGWPVWPAGQEGPDSPFVQQFVQRHAVAIEFYQYLQWHCEMQLASAADRAQSLAIGLYLDLAVGVAAGGADIWSAQGSYAAGARIGAPPDEFSPTGQDWGLPPSVPQAMRHSAYAEFSATLQANMRHAGALRIDHVMGLMRQFWHPPGDCAGAYVGFPWQDLFAIIALESHRNRCIVIGEDLGTVPDEVRGAMRERAVLSYRLLYFEKRWGSDHEFVAAADYPSQSLAAVATHDLPTLDGFWVGEDIAVREALGLFPSTESRDQQRAERALDRQRMFRLLHRHGLLPDDRQTELPDRPLDDDLDPEWVDAIHRFLASTPAQIMVFQMEDVFGQREQVNLPGTIDTYPNWRRKLSVPLQDWRTNPRLQSTVAAIRAVRS